MFQWLANNSTKSLDIIAQYWQLLANPKDPRSGDFGYSDSELQQFGAHLGSLVYKSIDNAANRNVNIRCSISTKHIFSVKTEHCFLS